MSTIQEKASKWDSLIKWIKDSADDEDTDVWEKLAELGVIASGEEEDYCDGGCGQKEIWDCSDKHMCKTCDMREEEL